MSGIEKLYRPFIELDMFYLKEIIEHKLSELERRKKELPERELRDYDADAKRVSLKERLSSCKPAIIAEIKRRSPSKGELRPITNVVAIAKTFANSGAAALSVLTDERFFGGSLEDLKSVKESISIPVLRKDFIIDPYQIYESRHSGADIILLIMNCLESGLFKDLYDLASELGLEVLVEVETIEDIRKLNGFEPELIGVNNRNLNTFEESINTSFDLFDSLPATSLKISESGLSNSEQITRLYKSGYRGFLIGESLMRSTDPGKKMKSFVKEVRKSLDE